MGYCGGGPAALDTFGALSAVVRWVEQNQPPESLTATGAHFPAAAARYAHLADSIRVLSRPSAPALCSEQNFQP